MRQVTAGARQWTAIALEAVVEFCMWDVVNGTISNTKSFQDMMADKGRHSGSMIVGKAKVSAEHFVLKRDSSPRVMYRGSPLAYWINLNEHGHTALVFKSSPGDEEKPYTIRPSGDSFVTKGLSVSVTQIIDEALEDDWAYVSLPQERGGSDSEWEALEDKDIVELGYLLVDNESLGRSSRKSSILGPLAKAREALNSDASFYANLRQSVGSVIRSIVSGVRIGRSFQNLDMDRSGEWRIKETVDPSGTSLEDELWTVGAGLLQSVANAPLTPMRENAEIVACHLLVGQTPASQILEHQFFDESASSSRTMDF